MTAVTVEKRSLPEMTSYYKSEAKWLMILGHLVLGSQLETPSSGLIFRNSPTPALWKPGSFAESEIEHPEMETPKTTRCFWKSWPGALICAFRMLPNWESQLTPVIDWFSIGTAEKFFSQSYLFLDSKCSVTSQPEMLFLISVLYSFLWFAWSFPMTPSLYHLQARDLCIASHAHK